MLRTFIAIKIAASKPLWCVLRTLREMGHGVRAVALDALHVTLRFLGPTEASSICGIHEAIEPETPFVLHVATLGAFPDTLRPKIIWAGIEPHDVPDRIAIRFNDALEKLGIQNARRHVPDDTADLVW